MLNMISNSNVIPKRNFKHRRVIVTGIDETWQADVQKIKYQNKHSPIYVEYFKTNFLLLLLNI